MISRQSKALTEQTPVSLSSDVTKSVASRTVGCPKLLLLKMLAEHRTGSLSFKDLDDPSVSWRVFLDRGQLVFAESCVGHTERLGYFLKLFLPDLEYAWPSKSTRSLYSLLCDLWAEYDLPAPMLQKVLAHSTQDVLIQIFALKKSEIVYDPTVYFPPVVKLSSFSAILDPVEPWISQWRGIRNEIHSPFQRLYIRNWDSFYGLIAYAKSGRQDLKQLDLALGKNYTLYQLAASLRMSIQDLAVLLHPLIKAGAIGVRPYREISPISRPLIASFNQRRFDQQLTQRTLERSGFDVLMLRNPNRVVEQLVKAQPAVALLDSNLTNVNPFEMCRSIRRERSLKDLPIILLMRDSRFMLEMRSQLAGANDCLKNPIKPQDLVKCVKLWQAKAA